MGRSRWQVGESSLEAFLRQYRHKIFVKESTDKERLLTANQMLTGVSRDPKMPGVLILFYFE